MTTQLLKAAEVADILRVGESTIYRMVHGGELPSVRWGRCIRIKAEDVETFIDMGGTVGHEDLAVNQ